MLLASTSTLSFSSMTGCTPMRPNSSSMVVMSCRCGRLHTVTGVSASRVAARIGRAAFFAPEMRISPSRRIPPVIISLSIAISLPAGSGALGPGGLAEEFHGHCVATAIGDPGIEVGRDLVLALGRAEGGQLTADQIQLEIAARAFPLDTGARHFGFQGAFCCGGLHGQPRSAD